MKIDHLKKATKVLKKITAIDAEIQAIETMAFMAADGSITARLSIEIADLENDTVRGSVKTDSSFNTKGLNFFVGGVHLPSMELCDSKKTAINATLNDKATLQVLGVLLAKLQAEKNEHLIRLDELGVKVK